MTSLIIVSYEHVTAYRIESKNISINRIANISFNDITTLSYLRTYHEPTGLRVKVAPVGVGEGLL